MRPTMNRAKYLASIVRARQPARSNSAAKRRVCTCACACIPYAYMDKEVIYMIGRSHGCCGMVGWLCLCTVHLQLVGSNCSVALHKVYIDQLQLLHTHTLTYARTHTSALTHTRVRLIYSVANVASGKCTVECAITCACVCVQCARSARRLNTKCPHFGSN